MLQRSSMVVGFAIGLMTALFLKQTTAAPARVRGHKNAGPAAICFSDVNSQYPCNGDVTEGTIFLTEGGVNEKISEANKYCDSKVAEASAQFVTAVAAQKTELKAELKAEILAELKKDSKDKSK